MNDEGGMMKDERRRTRDKKALKHAFLVIASGRPLCISFKVGRPSSIVLVLLVLSMLLSSCGYRFTHVGGIVPEDAKTIAIPAFVNGTAEPYVDVEVTKAVVNEFLTDGRLKVVSAESADLVLKGTVTKFDMTPSAYTLDNYVQSYTIAIGVNVSVEDIRTHKIIWQEKGLGSIFVAGYPVTRVNPDPAAPTQVDITATKIAKETALEAASRDVASTLRSRLLEGF
jgi:hypothetical protein